MFNKFNATFMSAVLTCLSLLWISPLLAEDSFYKRRSEGWHWYQDRKLSERKNEEDKKKVGHQSHQSLTPTQLLKLYRHELERRLHLAIFFPTLENVKAYQELQKDLMERGQLFAERWMQSIYLNSHLDFTSTYPINQIGRHTYIDEQNKIKRQKLKALSHAYGFFFSLRAIALIVIPLRRS
ncbi:MAG: conjugal transfer protein TraF [Holosporales bacterium]|nr:conjugal transfer protein TraF [Holosporales bacterium]